MTTEQILALNSTKHVKIYKLKQLGLKNSEIAALVGSNAGHVYNVLKDYSNSPGKAEKANSIDNNLPVQNKTHITNN